MSCPICYRTPGTWTDDPIKTPEHFNPACRGTQIIREPHIVEIRQALNAYEVGFGLTLTTWTPIASKQFMPRPQYINEMREAIEHILLHLGIPLADWLSWDANQEPTLGISGWLNGNRLSSNGIVRGMHIEELRKIIIEQMWQETWTKLPSEWVPPGTDPYPYDSTIADFQNWISPPGDWDLYYIRTQNQTETPTIHADYLWTVYLTKYVNFGDIQSGDGTGMQDYYPRNDTIDSLCHFLRDDAIDINLKSNMITAPNRARGGWVSNVVGMSTSSIRLPTKFKLTISDISKVKTTNWAFSTVGPVIAYWGTGLIKMFVNLTIYGAITTTYTLLRYERFENTQHPEQNYIIDIDNIPTDTWESPTLDGNVWGGFRLDIECIVQNQPLGSDQYIWCNLLSQLDLNFDNIKIERVITP